MPGLREGGAGRGVLRLLRRAALRATRRRARPLPVECVGGGCGRAGGAPVRGELTVPAPSTPLARGVPSGPRARGPPADRARLPAVAGTVDRDRCACPAAGVPAVSVRSGYPPRLDSSLAGADGIAGHRTRCRMGVGDRLVGLRLLRRVSRRRGLPAAGVACRNRRADRRRDPDACACGRDAVRPPDPEVVGRIRHWGPRRNLLHRRGHPHSAGPAIRDRGDRRRPAHQRAVGPGRHARGRRAPDSRGGRRTGRRGVCGSAVGMSWWRACWRPWPYTLSSASAKSSPCWRGFISALT